MMFSHINIAVENDLEPTEFYLSQNYPNPFKEKTTIKYCVAYKTRVQLTVYNTGGKLIEKLVDEEKEAGTYEVEFSSETDDRKLVSGNYLYRLVAGYYSCEEIMMIEK
jgi:hypothetical protein